MAGPAVMGSAALFVTGFGSGLLAGATSCAAVQLGLLTGAVRGGGRAVPSVSAFLAAKLAVHTTLGALLGILGAAIQPSPRVRGLLLTMIAVVLLLFALDLLGYSPARALFRRRHRCAPPPRPEPGGVRRPVVLGVSTVVVPCGLTLSVELLAVTSRSAVGGAAVMSGFVLGTAPLFALIGVALGRGLALLRGRLTALVGVGLLALAGWTLMSGLRLGGWLPETGDAGAEASARFVSTDSAGVQVVMVWAVDRGYRPAVISARAGVPTVLLVRTQGNRGCTRALVIPARNLQQMLPVTGATRIDLGSPGHGRLHFSCAAAHYNGSVSFR